MNNLVSRKQGFLPEDYVEAIAILDKNGNLITPSQEDGSIKTLTDRFIEILGPTGQSWDTKTTNIVTLHHSHDFIHDGLRFIAHEYTNLANGATKLYLIRTGTKLVHFIPKISTNAEIVYSLLEAPTVTVTGSAMTAYNRNRSSLNTPLCTFFFRFYLHWRDGN